MKLSEIETLEDLISVLDPVKSRHKHLIGCSDYNFYISVGNKFSCIEKFLTFGAASNSSQATLLVYKCIRNGARVYPYHFEYSEFLKQKLLDEIGEIQHKKDENIKKM